MAHLRQVARVKLEFDLEQPECETTKTQSLPLVHFGGSHSQHTAVVTCFCLEPLDLFVSLWLVGWESRRPGGCFRWTGQWSLNDRMKDQRRAPALSRTFQTVAARASFWRPRCHVTGTTGESQKRNKDLLLLSSVASDSLQVQSLYPARLLCTWNFPGKNTGVWIAISSCFIKSYFREVFSLNPEPVPVSSKICGAHVFKELKIIRHFLVC